MKINIDEQAQQWFHEELNPADNMAIKFYPRYGGDFQLKQGFGIAFTVEPLPRDSYNETVNGLTYFVDATDTWYFEDDTLNVTLNNDEISYSN
ncbi:hypothetical protein ERX37_03040 [Macrococcus hajekii]|uniref:HesB/YadR/YfhF family protein n=1 Tax=Macrococcus hajekii TaxID=198482 RepID=A0A4V3BE81_9STAP|nr:hypothetical protein [Macrococcus hajekii]TDM03075.1 hypothetical protein ERX37_03040 [Macrococcus hajekii]GGB06356.1 hypothetical protein GCM10007190_13010 [Macrococcus hajekii]